MRTFIVSMKTDAPAGKGRNCVQWTSPWSPAAPAATAAACTCRTDATFFGGRNQERKRGCIADRIAYAGLQEDA